MQFDYVADFHHVLRSRYLCLRFWLANVPVASICKGRAGKQKLVRRHHKVMENQKSSFRRYADVLEKLGLPVLLNFSSIYGEGKGNFAEIEPVTGPKGAKNGLALLLLPNIPVRFIRWNCRSRSLPILRQILR